MFTYFPCFKREKELEYYKEKLKACEPVVVVDNVDDVCANDETLSTFDVNNATQHHNSNDTVVTFDRVVSSVCIY